MGAYNDSPMATLLLKDEKIPSEILDSVLWVSTSSPFHASASMVNFEEENSTDTPFFMKTKHKMEIYNEDYDNCYQQPSRKRRLTTDQVRFLEKSFELENKLEPERKIQLARELGLQPRQVAIWFQNRRARCKSKVLEKEYDKLKASYDKLKADYDNLCKENEDMRNEVDTLTEKLLSREKKRAKLEPSSDHKTRPTDSPSKDPIFSPNAASNPESESAIPCRQEDVSSSDVFDSESLNCNHSLASDFSQDEDDESLSRRSSLLKASVFPKIEDEFYEDLQPNSCNLGFPIQDQGTWLWQY